MDPTETADTGARCGFWDNSACTGTPHCPPRCPRFVDTAGVPLLVRPYEDRDFDSLVDMYERLDPSSSTMGVPPHDRDGIVQWLDGLIDGGWNLLACDGDRVVGHVGVTPAQAPDPEFVIFVDDDYQHRGIGTELLKHVVATADDRDHDALRLTVTRDNRRAIDVYRNVAFDVTAREPMAIAMRLSLHDPVADRVQRPPAER